MPITTVTKINDYYQALLDKNPEYVGIFYVGVKTTSIFCISTCRARKPKKENTEFFHSVKEAMQHGYRPCKVCRPTHHAGSPPEQVLEALKLIKKHPKDKISDHLLRQQNISPEIVRRWFQKNYGLTFHAYQRMFRINNAFTELKEGKNTTSTAFDMGYESLSGFGYTYKKLMGNSPSQSKDQSIILINRFTTPLGPMYVCATEKGICLLEFTDRKMLETEFNDLQKRLNADILFGENEHIIQAKQEINEYFNGERTSFNIDLDPVGTDFQQSVWKELLAIPYGSTSSYQAQAEKLNRPKAIRAIARANGFNKIAIIIPCHRVIGKDGKLVGYAGGLERKRWLLEHESGEWH